MTEVRISTEKDDDADTVETGASVVLALKVSVERDLDELVCG